MSDRFDAAEADPILVCSEVHKRFGPVEVLNGVDLTVSRGEFVVLSGPSGGGKSTLLHLIAALEKASSGRILVEGHDVARVRTVNRYRRTEIGLVFQLHNLLPHMTAAQNVELAMFGTHRSPNERSRRAKELLERLDMSHAADRSPTRLSGGERQRVAIARALANEPPLLLADEPTGSLDRAAGDSLLDLLHGLRGERAMTIVMVTHDPSVAARADRHLELRDGRLEVAGVSAGLSPYDSGL